MKQNRLLNYLKSNNFALLIAILSVIVQSFHSFTAFYNTSGLKGTAWGIAQAALFALIVDMAILFYTLRRRSDIARLAALVMVIINAYYYFQHLGITFEFVFGVFLSLIIPVSVYFYSEEIGKEEPAEGNPYHYARIIEDKDEEFAILEKQYEATIQENGELNNKLAGQEKVISELRAQEWAATVDKNLNTHDGKEKTHGPGELIYFIGHIPVPRETYEDYVRWKSAHPEQGQGSIKPLEFVDQLDELIGMITRETIFVKHNDGSRFEINGIPVSEEVYNIKYAQLRELMDQPEVDSFGIVKKAPEPVTHVFEIGPDGPEIVEPDPAGLDEAIEASKAKEDLRIAKRSERLRDAIRNRNFDIIDKIAAEELKDRWIILEEAKEEYRKFAGPLPPKGNNPLREPEDLL